VLQPREDDLLLPSRHGRPLKYSHNHAVEAEKWQEKWEENVENVWTLKRIPSSNANIFPAVLLESIAA